MIFVEVYYGKLKVPKCDFAARQRSTRLYGKAVSDVDFQGLNRKLVCFFFCFVLFFLQLRQQLEDTRRVLSTTKTQHVLQLEQIEVGPFS